MSNKEGLGHNFTYIGKALHKLEKYRHVTSTQCASTSTSTSTSTEFQVQVRVQVPLYLYSQVRYIQIQASG